MHSALMVVYYGVITQDGVELNPSAIFKTSSERSENYGYCVLLNALISCDQP